MKEEEDWTSGKVDSGHISGREGPQQKFRDGESHSGKGKGPDQPTHIPRSQRRGRGLGGLAVLVTSVGPLVGRRGVLEGFAQPSGMSPCYGGGTGVAVLIRVWRKRL